MSWCGDQLDLPAALPTVPELVRVSTPREIRHIFNYCTFNYTMSWWHWERWEREIDYLAMNGINMPLAIVGVEAAWYHALVELGFSDLEARSFICAPVYVGWQWMSNLEGTGGPATRAWIDRREELGRRILDRQRSLGMTPILHGFCGHVPRLMIEKFPAADIALKGKWCGSFEPAAQLNPLDPFFRTVGQAYLKQLVARFGTDHFYVADPFHEGRPPVEGDEYLHDVGRAIVDLHVDADPDAVWVMQDWSMREPIARAAETDRLLIMSLGPGRMKNYHDWGYPATTGLVQNFGGRTHLHGEIDLLAENVFEKVADDTGIRTLVGTGLWNEGSQQNPLFYELAFDMNWRRGPVDLDHWTNAWLDRRYGASSQKARQAWELIRNGPYTLGGFGYSSMVAARPRLDPIKAGPNRALEMQYDTKDLARAWGLLLEERAALQASAGYRYDVTDVGRQCLSNLAFFYQRTCAAAFRQENLVKFREWVERFLALLEDLDELVGTQALFCFGRWMADAEDWASDEAERQRYRTHAAALPTIWGSDGDFNTLFDYGWREWNGMITTYYAERWRIFWNELDGRLAAGQSYEDGNEPSFFGRPLMRTDEVTAKVADFEMAWVANPPTDLPATGTGDSGAIAARLFDKYCNDLMKLPATATYVGETDVQFDMGQV